jgi:hypothetical protein
MSDHWKSLADLLGAPSLTPSRKPADPVAEEVNPEPTREQVAPPAPPVEAAPIVEPAKPKKRSSWEALANLFNIGSGPAPAPAPEPPPPPKPIAPPPPPAPPRAAAPPPRPVESSPKQSEISLFKPSAGTEQNPALVDMFGQASTKPHDSWGKPRKVVDDLGWDDEEPVTRTSKNEDTPVKPTRSLDETAEVDDVEMVDGEPVRRSRRRRSRGGRGRGEVARSNEIARPEESSAELRETDKWGSVVGDDSSDSDEDDVVISEAGDNEGPDSEGPDGEERRPRRRRRRRGRGRGAESSETRQPTDDNVDVESVNRDLLNTDDEDGPTDDLFEGPSADADADSSDPRRRRRRKRNRGGKPVDDPSQAAELDVDDADDLASAGRGGDDDEGEDGQRHRNIPTWEDSLSTIIEANIENHRRNEGRGGGPRGGGQRGGGGRNRSGGGRR